MAPTAVLPVKLTFLMDEEEMRAVVTFAASAGRW
jgi:hypothetical protein